MAVVAAALVLATSGNALAAKPGHGPGPRPPGHATAYDGGPARAGGDDAGEIADRAEEYSQARTAPAGSVSAAALVSARAQAAALPLRAGTWQEQTTAPYQAEPAGYTDPTWSNAGAGFDVVGGRTTGLARDGHELYAGTAGGGVWASNDGGGKWAPLTDFAATLSTGALAVSPSDHSVWIGTGEANTNQDSYLGTGVYKLATNGAGKAQGAPVLVGGSALVDHQVYRLLFDGPTVLAATSQGLYRTAADGSGQWTRVLAPTAVQTPYVNHITDVAVKPGTGGQYLVAVNGYRDGSPDNGVFASTDGGATWTRSTPTGALDGTDVGRTTLAYGGDGRLYALMESPAQLKSGVDAAGNASNLKGFYVSRSGTAAGPWTLLADSSKLGASGSALGRDISPGYNVGVQAWYNQALAVDATNPDRVYVSLEEVFSTTDGGATFTTASPYWDYGLACGTACPKTTHPDQHALLLSDDGRVVIGNDGGVFSRPVTVTGYGSWDDLNASLHVLQLYDASAGASGSVSNAPQKQLTYWGGAQDNGTAVVPGKGQSYEPAGGDGFDVIVDPADATRAVGEYTNLTAYSTTDGGHSFTTISPSCVGQGISLPTPRPDCDPNARFQAPMAASTTDPNHWVAGGRYAWDTTAGWGTRCDLTRCDWKPVFDLGASNAATAVASAGSTTYTAWVGGSGNPSPTFNRGIATNYGGTWHQLDVSSLPNRYIAGVTVDPADGAHAYAVFNGYSRRWIPGGGQGVVFETRDGGAHWSDLTGNLPDAPGDALVVRGGVLVLGTDVGVFAADAARPGVWSRYGSGLPNASTNNLTIAPTGAIVAATHGRGIWTLAP
ncbi:exo-alpha-sialidase [Rhodococcus aerolatus]